MYINWLNKAWENPFEALQQFPNNGYATPHFRLIKAIVDKNAKEADIVSLIRTVIRFEEVNKPGQYVVLQIPVVVANNVDRQSWEKGSIEIIKENTDYIFLRAKKWNPFYQLGGQSELFETHVLSLKSIRKDNSILGDPFLNLLSFQRYQSKAQREAVRSIICSPPGATIVINLPTGTGKSLCAFLPSVLPLSGENENLGVTPIVVPTVSLSLDMAKKLEPIVGHEVAYRPEDKEVAEKIRIRCKNGIQGPLIVSPESLTGSLSSVVLRAANDGFVNFFIIDEAHMVLSWGDEFRPGFQLLSALRKEMLLSCKSTAFKTILMSATLTQYHLIWLKTMFSEQNNFSISHTVNLRPEPSFWQLKAFNEESRKKIVLDTIFHLPKPAILYSVTRESATDWSKAIKEAGFNRVGLLHGQTNISGKKAVMKKWDEDQIDIMVATSAFGLGIDKPNVRAIIHLEIPETVDRFYQDVGRGGRDGFGCISFLCWCDEDYSKINNLQNPKFIGSERGLNRWLKMFNGKKIVDAANRVYELSLETPAEIDMKGEYNRQWNLRTLLLLERAEIIRILALDGNKINVKILQSNHTKIELWEGRVESLRQQIKREYEKSNSLLKNLLDGNKCLAKVFSECYKSRDFDIPVVGACSGCPACRREGSPAFQGPITPRRSPKEFYKPPLHSTNIKKMMGDSSLLSIYYSNQKSSTVEHIEDFVKFLKWIFQYEMVNITAFPELFSWLNDQSNFSPHWRVFLNETIPNQSTKHLLSIYILNDPLIYWWKKLWERIYELPGPGIILLPANISSPDHPGRKVRDVIPGKKLDYDIWEDEYLE